VEDGENTRLSAQAVRKVVDEQGGSSRSKLKALLKVFGYDKLTPERAQAMQEALAKVGLRTNPLLSDRGLRFFKSSWVIVQRVEPEAEAVEEEEVEINRAGMGLALAGAMLTVIAVFLPRVESTTFAKVKENTLIQSGDGGWLLIVLAVITAASVYRAFQQRTKTAAPLVLGLIIIGIAIYNGTGDRLDLTGTNLLGNSLSETATPGVGIYAAGVGGLLTALGGAWLAGFSIGAGGPMPPGRRTKQCPDCAETIHYEAKVCKHCGYRFDHEHQGGGPVSGWQT
jgi:uncharacterized membrane protein